MPLTHDEERAMRQVRETMREDSRKQAEAILTLAGLPATRLWELANGYWPDTPEYDDMRRPWWLAKTEIGLIRLGWRKRVLEIVWDDSAVRGLVTDDDVTKDDTFVHAYTADKAVAYVRRLKEIAQTQVGRAVDVPTGGS